MKTGNFKNSFLNTYSSTRASVSSSRFIRPVVIGILAFFVGLSAGMLFNPVRTTSAESLEVEPTKLDSHLLKSSIDHQGVDTLATSRKPAKTATNSPSPQAGLGVLSIPSIGVNTSVVSAGSSKELYVPNYGVSVYGNLLMGHVTTTFQGLRFLQNGQTFSYNGKLYAVTKSITLKVSEDRKLIGTYTTDDLGFRQGENTIVIMTCAGSMRSFSDGKNTYSHRILVFANTI